MKKNGTIKIVITVAVLALFVWFLVISPKNTFKDNEDKVREAVDRYFELNSSELPTGERTKTISLQTLYYKSFLKDDLYVPYSNQLCSTENSWVKVKRENGKYRYYIYLECGLLKSDVDHVGPVIKLNGDEKITINLGDSYKEPGVYSIVDNKDGKIDTKNIVIKGEVDTSKVGVYTLTYSATDYLNNRTTVERTVEVVQSLYSTVKKELNDQKNFVGDPENNYLLFSNMLFRIYGIGNDKNIRIVAAQDISNVNYSSLDKWLDYYYDHIMESSKKLIVDAEYCNMDLTDSTLDTTQCNSYTGLRKVYIPSVIDVNLANKNGINYMKPLTMSWLSNKSDEKKAFLTREVFFGEEYGKNYLAYDINENYGIRPMMTIKGSSLIIDGDGTYENPYILEDFQKVKVNTLLNKRFPGEYVSIDFSPYRILEAMDDGTIKVIGEYPIEGSIDGLEYNSDYLEFRTDISSSMIYDVKDKKSVGYFIKNKVSEFINTTYFVTHEAIVPIYKKKIMYGKEVSTNKISSKLFAPDMYDLFSATVDFENSYWTINSSKNKNIVGGIYPIGVPINDLLNYDMPLGIRLVAYIKKDALVISGKGTRQSPFTIK